MIQYEHLKQTKLLLFLQFIREIIVLYSFCILIRKYLRIPPKTKE